MQAVFPVVSVHGNNHSFSVASSAVLQKPSRDSAAVVLKCSQAHSIKSDHPLIRVAEFRP